MKSIEKKEFLKRFFAVMMAVCIMLTSMPAAVYASALEEFEKEYEQAEEEYQSDELKQAIDEMESAVQEAKEKATEALVVEDANQAIKEGNEKFDEYQETVSEAESKAEDMQEKAEELQSKTEEESITKENQETSIEDNTTDETTTKENTIEETTTLNLETTSSDKKVEQIKEEINQAQKELDNIQATLDEISSQSNNTFSEADEKYQAALEGQKNAEENLEAAKDASAQAWNAVNEAEAMASSASSEEEKTKAEKLLEKAKNMLQKAETAREEAAKAVTDAVQITLNVYKERVENLSKAEENWNSSNRVIENAELNSVIAAFTDENGAIITESEFETLQEEEKAKYTAVKAIVSSKNEDGTVTLRYTNNEEEWKSYNELKTQINADKESEELKEAWNAVETAKTWEERVEKAQEAVKKAQSAIDQANKELAIIQLKLESADTQLDEEGYQELVQKRENLNQKVETAQKYKDEANETLEKAKENLDIPFIIFQEDMVLNANETEQINVQLTCVPENTGISYSIEEITNNSEGRIVNQGAISISTKNAKNKDEAQYRITAIATLPNGEKVTAMTTFKVTVDVRYHVVFLSDEGEVYYEYSVPAGTTMKQNFGSFAFNSGWNTNKAGYYFTGWNNGSGTISNTDLLFRWNFTKINEDMTFKAVYKMRMEFYVLKRGLDIPEDELYIGRKDIENYIKVDGGKVNKTILDELESSVKPGEAMGNINSNIVNALVEEQPDISKLNLQDGEYIEWYVVKRQSDDVWHIDGIIRNTIEVEFVDEDGRAFVDENGKKIEDYTKTVGTNHSVSVPASVPSAYTADKTFIGWISAEDGTTLPADQSILTGITKRQVYKAVYTCNVIFKDTEGTILKSYTVDKGDMLQLDETFNPQTYSSKEWYETTGWKLEDKVISIGEELEQWIGITPITKNMELVLNEVPVLVYWMEIDGKWYEIETLKESNIIDADILKKAEESKDYVIFSEKEKENIAPEKVLKAAEELVKGLKGEDYTVEWKQMKLESTSTKNVIAGFHIEGIAKNLKYKVSFSYIDEKGELIETISYHQEGEKAEAPQVSELVSKEQQNLKFKGWIPQNAEYTLEDCGNVIRDMSFHANYCNVYKVTFLNEDNTIIQESLIEEGDAVNLPAAPVKEADDKYTYTFKMWKTEGNYTLEDCKNVKEEMTFIAVFTAAPVETETTEPETTTPVETETTEPETTTPVETETTEPETTTPVETETTEPETTTPVETETTEPETTTPVETETTESETTEPETTTPVETETTEPETTTPVETETPTEPETTRRHSNNRDEDIDNNSSDTTNITTTAVPELVRMEEDIIPLNRAPETSSDNTDNIQDESEEEKYIEIEDEEIPLAAPKTGDTNKLFVWVIMMGMSILTMYMVIRKKEEK